MLVRTSHIPMVAIFGNKGNLESQPPKPQEQLERRTNTENYRILVAGDMDTIIPLEHRRA